MVSVSRLYNGVLNYCISNHELKLEISRREKKVQGNPLRKRELATEFLTKAKELSSQRGLQALREWSLYSDAANRLVGVVMAMAISDSLYLHIQNSKGYCPSF